MADVKTLADSTTTSGSLVTITSSSTTYGFYVSGLSSDTITVQYRPSSSDSWVDASGLTSIGSDKLDILQFVPGQYQLTRSGNNDSVTVKLVVQ